MGPNGSINNSVYVNPFEPGRDGRRRQVFRESPGSPRRRKRMSSRSRSTDLAELDGTRETSLREGRGPKHKRPRGNQVTTLFFTPHTFASEKKVGDIQPAKMHIVRFVGHQCSSKIKPVSQDIPPTFCAFSPQLHNQEQLKISTWMSFHKCLWSPVVSGQKANLERILNIWKKDIIHLTNFYMNVIVCLQGPWVVDVEEYCFEGAHRSSNLSSNMPAAAAASTNANMSAKIAAALNQGFSTLGGRLGNTF